MSPLTRSTVNWIWWGPQQARGSTVRPVTTSDGVRPAFGRFDEHPIDRTGPFSRLVHDVLRHWSLSGSGPAPSPTTGGISATSNEVSFRMSSVLSRGHEHAKPGSASMGSEPPGPPDSDLRASSS